MSKIVCFGEVLWDVFPDGSEKVGGAPLNVALRLKDFGHEVIMLSAIGTDALGTALIAHLEERHLSAAYVQQSKTHPTGTVQVQLDANGSANYTIAYPSAWDHMECSQALLQEVRTAQAFVFGSLITRNAVSKDTLFQLLEVAPYTIFDLNLRPPHYTETVLTQLMATANFIKFNDEELDVVCQFLGGTSTTLEAKIEYIAAQTATAHICVTMGADGAVLWYEGQFYKGKGYPVTVVDTVGAGDSFLGTLISQLLNGIPPQDAINKACAVGALVAGIKGATPHLSATQITDFMESK